MACGVSNTYLLPRHWFQYVFLPHSDYPLIEVGTISALDQSPDKSLARIEQAAFEPARCSSAA